MVEMLISGATAGILTLFDLDRTFYIPEKIDKRVRLWCWWWGFVVVNAVLGGSFYWFFGDLEQLESIKSPIRALVVGASYLAIVRLKITTIDMNGKPIPLGLELLYEGAKDFFFKRINRIAIAARRDETMALASISSLQDLKWKALHRAKVDAMVSNLDRVQIEDWIRKVCNDSIEEFEKNLALADYILSGKI